MIDIQELEGFPRARYTVTVSGATETLHEVTVQDDTYQRLTDGQIAVEKLVRLAFEFLLEREENTEILGAFELGEISHYFGDFEAVMSKQIAEAQDAK